MQRDDRWGGCWEAVGERCRSVDAPTRRRKKSPADRLGSDADFEMKIAHLLGFGGRGFQPHLRDVTFETERRLLPGRRTCRWKAGRLFREKEKKKLPLNVTHACAV